MRTSRRWLIAAALFLAIVAATALTIAIPTLRSTVALAAAKFALGERGFALHAGRLAVARDVIEGDDVEVDDALGQRVFTAAHVRALIDPAVWLGNSDRRYGIVSLSVDRPLLRIVRLADGSYNLSPLMGGPPSTRPTAPIHATLAVRSGRLEFADPSAPAKIGRAFAIDGIDGDARLDQGGLSRIAARGSYEAAGAPAPVSFVVDENDAERFATATLRAGALDAAPVIDGIAPTSAFVAERADVRAVQLRAFAVDYDPASGPRWQFSGSAFLQAGRFRVVPLTRPVDDVHGPLIFSGGHLSGSDLEGTLAGSPLHIRGGIRLFGGVWLALSAQGAETLEAFRHDFAFSDRLDVSGPLDVDVRIDGRPADVAVAGRYGSAGTVAYGGIPLDALSGVLFYHGGHITFPSVRATYEGAPVALAGDVDLSVPRAATGRFAVLASAPAALLPLAVNVNPDGNARALAALDGPLGAMEGSGFLDVSGGNGTTVRGAVYAGPRRFAVGPLLLRDPGGGAVLASGGIDRTPAMRTIGGRIDVASADLRLLAGARALPGIIDIPIALPPMSGTLSGVALVGGAAAAPAVYVDARTTGLTVAGTRLGDARLIAMGTGGRVHIARATIDGPDTSLALAGDAIVEPTAGRYAASLSGTGGAALAALPALAGVHAAGEATGSFAAVSAGGRWTVLIRASGRDARIGGVPVERLDATLGGGSGGPAELYAGRLSTAAGAVSAIGDVPGAKDRGGALRVWTEGVDLGSVAPAGRVRGRAVATFSIGGTIASPAVSGAASVSDARVADQPVSGDVQLRFRGDRFEADAGRVALGGGFADVSGSLTGIGGGRPLHDARLALVASMREGDIAALTRRYLPPNVRLAGAVDATLDVGGTVGSPHASGVVESGSGTLQGVGFSDLHGVVDATSRSIDLTQGSVAVGSSRFAFGGSLSPTSAHVNASSADVDLSDFNDFFEGYDTLEGRGYGQIAFQSTRTGILGSGAIGVGQASVLGFPVGTVRADFASRGDQLLLDLRQRGDAGSSELHGGVAFGARQRALPDLRTARYDLRGSIHAVDLGRIMPLFGEERLGLTGFIDASGSLRGALRAPAAHADVSLRDGHIGRIAIERASGGIDSDGTRVTVRDAVVDLPFAHIDGGGTIGPGKKISASVGVNASDLGSLLAVLGKPNVASGTAIASIGVTGAFDAPHVATTIVSGRGAALGVRFDRISGSINYQPGEVDIADAEVDLGGGKGVLTIGGTLPLQLQPFGLGPKSKPIGLRLAAKAVDLSALDPLTSRYAAMTGMLDASGGVTGTAGRPQLSGSAQLRDASIVSPFETVPAQHVRADLSLAGDTLTLTHLTGDLGRGAFAGSGSLHIIPAVGLLNVAGLQYWSRLNFRDAQVDVPGWSSGSLNGDVRLTKSGTIPFLQGDVTLDDGNVPFSAIYRLASGYGSGPSPEGGPLPGVPTAEPGHIVVYGGPVFGEGGPYVLSAAPGAVATVTGPVLPSVDLAVNARAGRNVRVHGGAIDLTASGQVLIGGNLRAPTVAGTFASARGQIGYFDTNFRLVRGTVTFDPVEGLLPTLDVKAVTNLNGAEITLTVTGRVDNLQTDLSSNPSMSRDEIVATLLHAPQVRSVISTTPGQAQTALYAEAQSYFNAQLTRSLLFPVESLLAQTINVEQISLIYDQQGKVDVEIRKLISPTVYAIYRSSLNIPVTQTAGVAYSLRDYADLEILQTQSSSGLQQTVLNLRLTFH